MKIKSLLSPMSRNTFLALFLSTFVLSAQSQSVTGTWSWRNSNESSGHLRTIQIDKKVQFQLELQRGSPSFNSGFIEGEFELLGKNGVFRGEKEYDECEINFRFQKSKVVLETIKNSCGFGNGVMAQGTFFLRSKGKPLFSAGDPRFSN